MHLHQLMPVGLISALLLGFAPAAMSASFQWQDGDNGNDGGTVTAGVSAGNWTDPSVWMGGTGSDYPDDISDAVLFQADFTSQETTFDVTFDPTALTIRKLELFGPDNEIADVTLTGAAGRSLQIGDDSTAGDLILSPSSGNPGPSGGASQNAELTLVDLDFAVGTAANPATITIAPNGKGGTSRLIQSSGSFAAHVGAFDVGASLSGKPRGHVGHVEMGDLDNGTLSVGDRLYVGHGNNGGGNAQAGFVTLGDGWDVTFGTDGANRADVRVGFDFGREGKDAAVTGEWKVAGGQVTGYVGEFSIATHIADGENGDDTNATVDLYDPDSDPLTNVTVDLDVNTLNVAVELPDGTTPADAESPDGTLKLPSGSVVVSDLNLGTASNGSGVINLYDTQVEVLNALAVGSIGTLDVIFDTKQWALKLAGDQTSLFDLSGGPTGSAIDQGALTWTNNTDGDVEVWQSGGDTFFGIVPEPTTLVLLAGGAVAALRRRRA